MPMYEYICLNKKCANIFTELAKFEDKIKCPICKKVSEKQMSTTHHPVFIHGKSRFKKKRRL